MASVAQGTCNPIDPAIKLFGRTIEKLNQDEPCTFNDFKSNGDLQIDLDLIRRAGELPATPYEIHPDSNKLNDSETERNEFHMHCKDESENEDSVQMHQNKETEAASDNSPQLPNEEQSHDGNGDAKEQKNDALEISGNENHNEDKTGKNPSKKPDKPVPCPRCQSLDTKFCYFNNYNVNQPRHFCKNCQRYWTAGGSLRNVPVGAGRRKNKSSCSSLNSNMNGAGQHINRRQLADLVVGVRSEHSDSAQQVLTMESLNNHLNISHAKHFISDTAMPRDVKTRMPSSTVLSFVQDGGMFEDGMLHNNPEVFKQNVMGKPDANAATVTNKYPKARNGQEPIILQEIPKLNMPNASFNIGSTMTMTTPIPSPALGLNPSPINAALSMPVPLPIANGHDGQVPGWAAPGAMFPFMGGPWPQYPSNTGWAVPPPLTTSVNNTNPQCVNPNQSPTLVATNQSPWPGAVGAFWPGFPWPLMWPSPGSWPIPWTPAAAAAAATAIAAAAATAATNDPMSGKREREDDQKPIIDGNGPDLPTMPKLLRIGDPGEAIRSSILEVLGVDKKIESGGIFGAFQQKSGNHDKDSDWLQARFSNPAALARSFSFQEKASQN